MICATFEINGQSPGRFQVPQRDAASRVHLPSPPETLIEADSRGHTRNNSVQTAKRRLVIFPYAQTVAHPRPISFPSSIERRRES